MIKIENRWNRKTKSRTHIELLQNNITNIIFLFKFYRFLRRNRPETNGSRRF